MRASKYEIALGKSEANYEPLSAISFLERRAFVLFDAELMPVA